MRLDIAKLNLTLLLIVRWKDPACQEGRHEMQRASIQLAFLSARITLYRRFISEILHDDAPAGLPMLALASCSKDACGIIDVFEVLRDQPVVILPCISIVFGAATVLLLHIWYLRRRQPDHPDLLMLTNHIERCKTIFKSAEKKYVDCCNRAKSMLTFCLDRWSSAGKFV